MTLSIFSTSLHLLQFSSPPLQPPYKAGEGGENGWDVCQNNPRGTPPMTDTTINPTDYIKYIAAESSGLIESAQQAICSLDADDDRVEAILSQLDAVGRCAIEAAAVFCRDGYDMDHYADGRRVRTRLELEKGNEYEHVWHPQVDHRHQPGTRAVSVDHDQRETNTVAYQRPWCPRRCRRRAGR